MPELVFHHCSLAAASEHTICPSCGSAAGTKVYQTVAATLTLNGRKIKGIGRTRRCYKCSHKWRTFETSPEALAPEAEL